LSSLEYERVECTLVSVARQIPTDVSICAKRCEESIHKINKHILQTRPLREKDTTRERHREKQLCVCRCNHI